MPCGRLGQSVTGTSAQVTTSAMFHSLEVTLGLHVELYMTYDINPVVLQQFSVDDACIYVTVISCVTISLPVFLHLYAHLKEP